MASRRRSRCRTSWRGCPPSGMMGTLGVNRVAALAAAQPRFNGFAYYTLDLGVHGASDPSFAAAGRDGSAA